ncbi:hypothetical protein L596_019343 [Steinernema carpocapsae]|uniref:Uncharacterized protein n=1 Tax=Steinernema carpocapsae TaxID=34508 RepID=A0A4U5MQD6_STECR|nr:hypothetical protein L596_019343 [Steinernema carpocapsae]
MRRLSFKLVQDYERSLMFYEGSSAFLEVDQMAMVSVGVVNRLAKILLNVEEAQARKIRNMETNMRKLETEVEMLKRDVFELKGSQNSFMNQMERTRRNSVASMMTGEIGQGNKGTESRMKRMETQESQEMREDENLTEVEQRMVDQTEESRNRSDRVRSPPEILSDMDNGDDMESIPRNREIDTFEEVFEEDEVDLSKEVVKALDEFGSTRMKTFSGDSEANFENWVRKFEDWVDAQVSPLSDEQKVKKLKFYLEGNARE